MKGTVIACLQDLVVSTAGIDTWREILRRSGLNPHTIFVISADVDDAAAVGLIASTCATLGITSEQAGDAFGAHWIGVYAPKMYASFFAKHTSSRSFLIDLNQMHARLTQALPGARPPVFQFSWPEPDLLQMDYESHRSLLDIAVGMTRALGRHYGESLDVTKISPTTMHVRFPAAARAG